MRAFVGITDWDWYQALAFGVDIEEVNFWQPSGNRAFSAIQAGELFLFKLHSPRNFIVGGGIFAHSTLLPVSLAWETFGFANGALSLPEMRARIEHYRQRAADPLEDYVIGCVLLTQPFFFPKDLWIPVPSDWRPNIVQGKTYDLTAEPGLSLYQRVHESLAHAGARRPELVHELPQSPTERYGPPTLITPRLGQGGFRMVVIDAYARRCAVSGEKVLPVLQASHIKPFAAGGEHRTDNGILLRSDLHTLFDRGYMTFTSDYTLEVSRRIRDEFDNGEEYFALRGRLLRRPMRIEDNPTPQNLLWHNEHVYKG